MSRDQLPVLSQVLKKGGLFFAPFVVIVYMIMTGYSPLRAALYGFVSIIVLAYLHRESWLSLRDWWDGLGNAGHGILIPAVACGAAGIVIGTFTLDGLGLLTNGSALEIAHVTFTAALGTAVLAGCVIGWFWTFSYWWERILLALAAFMCIMPQISSDLAGIVLIAVILAVQVRCSRSNKRSTSYDFSRHRPEMTRFHYKGLDAARQSLSKIPPCCGELYVWIIKLNSRVSGPLCK